MKPTLAYCVVNTNGRDYLRACLDSIAKTHPEGVAAEILVLDNASDDGSAEAVREWDRSRRAPGGPALRLIALDERAGKAENDSRLMRETEAEFCLLLNEDSELLEGATEALLAALEADPKAGVAGAQLLDADRNPYPCAWRFPGVGTAAIGALFLHRVLTVQSKGAVTRPVDWAQSSALMVRRRAGEEIDYLDPDFFVYYDECDFCKRLTDAGWKTVYVPAARAIHHDQLATDLAAGLPRIVEFHRNRDLYMRKHHSPAAATTVRVLIAWSYAVRGLTATVRRSETAPVMWVHARQALLPRRGAGIRDRVVAGRQRQAQQC